MNHIGYLKDGKAYLKNDSFVKGDYAYQYFPIHNDFIFMFPYPDGSAFFRLRLSGENYNDITICVVPIPAFIKIR